MSTLVMRKLKYVVIFCIGMISWLLSFNPPPVDAETISGHVYESDGSTPIANVVVQAYSACGGSYAGTVYVDSSGAYTFNSLSPGTNYLFACTTSMCGFADLDYVSEWYGGSSDCVHSTPVMVNGGVNTEHIDFQLNEGASVSGNVYEIDGTTPVPFASVIAYSAAWGATPASGTTTPSIAAVRIPSPSPPGGQRNISISV